MLADTDTNTQPYIWGKDSSYWDPDLYRLCSLNAHIAVKLF